MAERKHQLPDELVCRLLDSIEELGDIYADAKARSAKLEHDRKGMKAAMMNVAQAHGIGAHQRQEVYALTNPAYQAVVAKVVDAIAAEVKAQVRFQNAEREYEAWRTISANQRAAR